MIEFIKTMYKKYEEAISYLFFGFLAFVVNTGAYALAAWVLGANNEKIGLVMASNIFAWVTAVLFAYWTNRTFVFKSKVSGGQELLKEFSAFIGARVITGLLDMAIVYVIVVINVDDFIAKFVSNVVVIIANYIFSKLWIFKKKEA